MNMKCDFNYIEKWIPEISLEYKSGGQAINLGLIITMYFKDGHIPGFRKNMIDCARRFHCEFKNRAFYLGEERIPYSESVFQLEALRRLRRSEEEQFSWGMTSAEEKYHSPDFSLWFSSPRIFHNETDRSVIKLTFPLSYIKKPIGMKYFQAWIKHLCESFNIECGYAGLSFILPDCLPYELEHLFPYEYTRAIRFPGILVDSGGRFEGSYAVSGIKTVSWYTILGKNFVDKLGEKFFYQIDDIETLNFGDTVALKTGDMPPSLGEIYTELMPSQLVRVNEFLSSIRLKEMYSFHLYIPGKYPQFDETTSKEWLKRLDK